MKIAEKFASWGCKCHCKSGGHRFKPYGKEELCGILRHVWRSGPANIAHSVTHEAAQALRKTSGKSRQPPNTMQYIIATAK